MSNAIQLARDVQRELAKTLPGEPAMLEHFDFSDMREHLKVLPPIKGEWPNPASLSRFGLTEMDQQMQKRFFKPKRIKVAQLDYQTPCWLWMGGTHEKGYGRFHLGFVDGVRITAYTHRISFEHFIGFPPPGYIVDHQCNHKVCINPTHLWPESNPENLRLADLRRPWKRRNQYSQE